MTPPNALVHKGEAIEEWTDVHFFRPLGFRVARLLLPTSVTADQVTLACLALGLVAGHLFVYQVEWLNALGVVLFVVSDILDSADGQLARMRNASTRFGRALDGVADSLRFLCLYIHLLFRAHFSHWGWQGYALVLGAALSHSLQGQISDFVKNAYQRLGEDGGGELDLYEELEPVTGYGPRELAGRIYRSYVQRQDRLFPATMALVRATPVPPPAGFMEAYVARQGPLLNFLPMISQNIRFLLLAIGTYYGMSWFLWLSVVPLNVVAALVVALHERNSRALLGEAKTVPVRP